VGRRVSRGTGPATRESAERREGYSHSPYTSSSSAQTDRKFSNSSVPTDRHSFAVQFKQIDVQPIHKRVCTERREGYSLSPYTSNSSAQADRKFSSSSVQTYRHSVAVQFKPTDIVQQFIQDR
jgi:hypothetical protein